MINKNKRHIITKLLPVLILVGILLPSIAHAEEGSWLLNVTGTVVKKTIAFVGETIYGFTVTIMTLAGGFFDYTLDLSIKAGDNLLLGAGSLVQEGWTAVRDLANMAFLFVLIFIGIATIIQLPAGYGMKQLLVKVIIIALLVNFSMAFANIVIKTSNMLALEIRDKIAKPGVSLSSIYAYGLDIQSIKDIRNVTEFPGNSEDKAIFQTIVIFFFGSVLILVASFVLIVGGLLFLMRSVILALVVMLAPLAFIAMIFPATKKYAAQWWSALFKQSFFAPAFLLLFYLVSKLILSRQIFNMLGTDQATWAGVFIGKMTDNFALVAQYVLLTALMLACLTIATTMGGAAGSAAVSGAHWVRKRYMGAVDLQNKGLGRILRRVAGPTAEAIATGKGEGRAARFGEWARTIPIVGGVTTRAAAKVGVSNRERIAEIQKNYQRYSDLELKNLLPTLPFSFNRAAIVQELINRDELEREGGLDKTQIEKAMKLFDHYNISTRPIKNRSWQYEMPEEVLKKTDLTPEYFGKILSQNKSFNFINKAKRKDQTVAQHYIDIMADWAKGAKDATEALNKVSQEFTKKGNTTMAQWMYSTAARGMMTKIREVAGVPDNKEQKDKKETKEKEKPKQQAGFTAKHTKKGPPEEVKPIKPKLLT
ncbi:type IV secretion system protein [Patescibacteria group bacterium]